MRLSGLARLDQFTKAVSDLENLYDCGFISEGLRKYVEQLSVIDFASWEALQYANQGLQAQGVKSIVDAKLAPDTIAANFLKNPMYNNEPLAILKMSPPHQSLFDVANERYHEAEAKFIQASEATA